MHRREPALTAIPDDIQKRLQGHLTEIARLFNAPRITLIVRAPGEPSNVKGDLILGNDDPLDVAKALRARMIGEAEILAGTPQAMRVVEKERDDGEYPGARLQPGGNASDYQPRK